MAATWTSATETMARAIRATSGQTERVRKLT